MSGFEPTDASFEGQLINYWATITGNKQTSSDYLNIIILCTCSVEIGIRSESGVCKNRSWSYSKLSLRNPLHRTHTALVLYA